MTMNEATPVAPTSAAEPEVRVPHRWRNLGLITGGSVIDSGDTSIVPTLFPTLQNVLHVQLSALGI
ncbi:hypothetical protein GCM10011575_09440 [Microlunatus endophyticus]|uniref:Uncharacterized protein n=1 Tax=Microlunatus endophyticus TaxID=1716077 RepID=A0A917S1Z5_9ACTN|nr:hypothetical protein [Microlunatus endophyticus]GGL53184.1 hypothetical protein GCM10011575_09440 [Microlunatus endophyticus]